MIKEENLDIPKSLKREKGEVIKLVPPSKPPQPTTNKVQVAPTPPPATPEKPASKPDKPAVATDQFGIKVGTKKSKAAAMYATDKGATLKEVADKLGGIQFNVLRDLKAKGFKVEETVVEGQGKRKVTRYKLHQK